MLDRIDKELLRSHCYINGRWIGSNSGDTFAVRNPADGTLLANVPLMGREETRSAVEAAQNAWPKWRVTTAKERSSLLRKWCDLVLLHRDDLALLMTSEQGKPLAEARGEVLYAASFIEWFSEEAKRVYGDTIPQPSNDRRIVIVKEPVGVCAAITPWNFPAAMITRKIAPALAAGCTVVVKPASATPLTALALAELAHRAGLPSGVFNVITGRSEIIGKELTANPMVRKLTFTGSTEVGKILMRECAATVKKISLELGGHAPFIVFDDADIDAAIQGAMAAKYRNSGQTCVCPNRFLVQTDIYDAFVERLIPSVRTLKVANGLADGVQQGPLIDRGAVQKVEDHIEDALRKGATLLAGGRRHSLGGNFFEPTILGNVTPQMKIAYEETFGPVAPVMRFETETEAIRSANSTPYGLAAYFYSRDMGRIWRVAEALEFGMVGINTGAFSTEVAPFGGMKQSGLGREGSKYGMDEYLEIKYLCMGGI